MLASAFLRGEWSAEALVSRGENALGGRPRRWLPQLATAVIRHFGARPPLPRWRPLAEFLASQRAVKRLRKYQSQWSRRNGIDLPSPLMLPATALQHLSLPAITTEGNLAAWLSLAPGELNWFADCLGRERSTPPGPLRHYRYRPLRKASGQIRVLEAPKPRLKRLQRRLLHEILDRIPPHPAAHAFRAGRSVASYVAPHAGQDVVLHVDLREFFPSIRASRINALLRTIGYPEAVARLIAGLCTNSTPRDALTNGDEPEIEFGSYRFYREPHLPQGAPTSPALANLCAYRLDVRLSALARRFGAEYSRYADDLLFSGGAELAQGLSRFRTFVLAIALDEGFSIRARKTRVMRRHESQRAAGVILNTHPNLPRKNFDSLRALLFNCARFGPSSQNHAGHADFREHLRGRIAYSAMINESRSRKLQALFDRIDWQR